MARVRLAALAVLVLAVTAACGRPPDTGGAADAVPFDQQFIDMLVPHREGAVEMARIAQQRGEHAEVKQMAAEIIVGHPPEIAQLKQWRAEWFGSDQTPPMNVVPMVDGMDGQRGVGHGGQTMDLAADVEELRRAGEPFDRAFLDAMIPYQEHAVDAARAAIRAQRPEIKRLAGAIIADEEREIAQMKEWRRAWYGA